MSLIFSPAAAQKVAGVSWASGRLLGASGRLLGASWGSLGALWGSPGWPSGALLGRFEALQKQIQDGR